jgi:hypothetical protein
MRCCQCFYCSCDSSYGLLRFLRSFLAVIIGISMLTSRLSREDMFHAVDNGASWTQSHVLNRPNKLYVTFDEFAEWYITPSSLINAPLPNEIGQNSIYAPPNIALRTAHPHHPPKDVLFTFPLTNENELVVLKDDVFYVRSVVEQLITRFQIRGT